MKIACIICARQNSKGLPNKNFKKLKGIPLIEWTISQAKKIREFDYILLSTDNIKLSKFYKKKYNIENVKRPSKISKDNTSKTEVIYHGLSYLEKKYNTNIDYIVDLDVTTPLRKISDIRRSLKKLINSKFDNLVSVNIAKKNPYFNIVELSNNKIKYLKSTNKTYNSRQSSPKVYELNGAIYIWKRKLIINKKLRNKLITNSTMHIEIERNTAIDIDTKLDWRLINAIIEKKYD